MEFFLIELILELVLTGDGEESFNSKHLCSSKGLQGKINYFFLSLGFNSFCFVKIGVSVIENIVESVENSKMFLLILRQSTKSGFKKILNYFFENILIFEEKMFAFFSLCYQIGYP